LLCRDIAARFGYNAAMPTELQKQSADGSIAARHIDLGANGSWQFPTTNL
jgi:hypothetical protein